MLKTKLNCKTLSRSVIGFWELEIELKKDIAQMLRDWIGRKCDKSMIF